MNFKKIQICDLQTGTPKIVGDVKQQNRAEKFQICKLWTNLKIWMPTFIGDKCHSKLNLDNPLATFELLYILLDNMIMTHNDSDK